MTSPAPRPLQARLAIFYGAFHDSPSGAAQGAVRSITRHMVVERLFRLPSGELGRISEKQQEWISERYQLPRQIAKLGQSRKIPPIYGEHANPVP